MILIGPAGSSGLGNIDGIKKVRELDLDAMEVEFTYGVRMSDAMAKEVGKLAKELNVTLSIHAPYYCNLASLEEHKIVATRQRILDSCQKAELMGAKYVVFHAGFYQDRDKKEVYEIIRGQIIKLQKTLEENSWKTKLAPETTGKATQFGDVDELLALREETGCELCVDYAHLEARYQKEVDYDGLFSKMKKIKHIHSHFSGIEYTAKGERRHKLTPEDKIKRLLSAMKKHKINGTIINESPDPVGDAVRMKNILKQIY